MNTRGVAVQGGLAAAALVAAYFTWQRQPELVAGEVFALDIAKGDLEKVRYEDKDLKSFAELVRDKDENGTFVSVRLSGSDATGVHMPSTHPAVPIKVPERYVRGNEAAQRLFERIAPLCATRALGVLDGAKLKDLGLDTTKKRIEVVGRGTRRSYAISPAPPGGMDPYIRDEKDGRVYIVSRTILSDLQAATTNLVERRMHSFKIEDVDRLVVYAAGKKKEFRANRIEELPGIRLTPMTGDKPDETTKNWHDRVWNLFPSEVLGKGEQPDGGAPKAAVRVEYFMRGRSLGWVELARKPAPQVNDSTTTPTPAAADAAFGRSEFSLGWMKLPQDANALINEGETLVGRP
jgi:Domain of unknown function (DUF4340)